MLGTKNRNGADYFQLFLQNAAGEFNLQPIIIGLHSQGKYPAYNWIEISLLSIPVNFGTAQEILDTRAGGLTQKLFQYLVDLIPPGGHLMVEYDNPGQEETVRPLAFGIPPVATPLGYIMFLAGCDAGFKDWYFAEGGIEGPRKLQGYKALNSHHAQLKAEETIKELKAFLNKSLSNSELEKAARKRARAILYILEEKI